jgi:hypothetical protein
VADVPVSRGVEAGQVRSTSASQPLLTRTQFELNSKTPAETGKMSVLPDKHQDFGTPSTRPQNRGEPVESPNRNASRLVRDVGAPLSVVR